MHKPFRGGGGKRRRKSNFEEGDENDDNVDAGGVVEDDDVAENEVYEQDISDRKDKPKSSIMLNGMMARDSSATS